MRFPDTGFSYFGPQNATPRVEKDLKEILSKARLAQQLPPEDGSKLSGQPAKDMLQRTTPEAK